MENNKNKDLYKSGRDQQKLTKLIVINFFIPGIFGLILIISNYIRPVNIRIIVESIALIPLIAEVMIIRYIFKLRHKIINDNRLRR